MNRFRLKVHEIIFEADTLLGKIFDILLLVMILLSVGVVMLESVEGYRLEWFWIFDIFEWVFTILFSFESILSSKVLDINSILIGMCIALPIKTLVVLNP